MKSPNPLPVASWDLMMSPLPQWMLGPNDVAAHHPVRVPHPSVLDDIIEANVGEGRTCDMDGIVQPMES